jgi:hypothetical protein
MKKPLEILQELTWARLGQCPHCMRKAFQGGLVAWGAWCGALVVGIPSPMLACIMLAAGALTTLWVAHLLAFSFKVSVSQHANETSVLPRRAFFWNFARAAAFATAGTALPASIAHAARGKHRNPLDCSSVGLNCPCCCNVAGVWVCWGCDLPCDDVRGGRLTPRK